MASVGLSNDKNIVIFLFLLFLPRESIVLVWTFNAPVREKSRRVEERERKIQSGGAWMSKQNGKQFKENQIKWQRNKIEMSLDEREEIKMKRNQLQV